MKRNLTLKENIVVASMLFGLFFGAGNLIFPVSMGQQAGSQMWPAFLGFFITGVGLPLLGIAALGLSRSTGLFDLSCKVNRLYAYFFTCLLYLTIGPFAIPRCAATSFTVGLEQILPEGGNVRLYLLIFARLLRHRALFFALPRQDPHIHRQDLESAVSAVPCDSDCGRHVAPPRRISRTSRPMPPMPRSRSSQASSAAITRWTRWQVSIRHHRRAGHPRSRRAGAGDIAANTVRAGIFSCLFMGVIYLFVTIVGTQSRGLFAAAENGGTALAQIAQHYLGYPGLVILAATVTLACLKTAVGHHELRRDILCSSSCAGPAYRVWAALFAVISFLFANPGPSSITHHVSVPVLMFLYPLSITLILLAPLRRLFHHDRAVYNWVIGCTLVASVYDLLRSLPDTLPRGLPSGRPAGRRRAAFCRLPRRGLVGSARPFSASSSASSSISRKAPHKLNPEKTASHRHGCGFIYSVPISASSASAQRSPSTAADVMPLA